ncbi:hypothetical protein RSOL_515410, partial [Rhizoctonia solani AG-3 Rhs1AP]
MSLHHSQTQIPPEKQHPFPKVMESVLKWVDQGTPDRLFLRDITFEDLERVLDRLHNIGRKPRYDWDLETHTAVLRMPSILHEIPGEWLNDRIKEVVGPKITNKSSPPAYSATATTGNDHYRKTQPQSAGFSSASSVRPNLPPRCNYFIDRKVFSSVSGTWHVDTALEIPEHLLLPITNFDGHWNREAQRTRKGRAAELRKRLERSQRRNLPLPSVETRPNLMLATSNGAISGDIHVMSSDGLIRQTSLAAQGFNGSVDLKIHAPSEQPLRVFASTTNGSIN